jgi:AraC family transcriptional regulator
MEWLKNLSKAIEYIEDHLDDDICYEETARIACCSTFYFQRMFSYVTGISLSEYIRRRRMTQAAFDIRNTDIRVLDAALKYGYSSPTSFNRAFQKVHGISPVSAKTAGSVINAYPPIKLSVNITGGDVMPYRIEEKEAMRIVGIRIPLTADMEENKMKVPPFWKTTFNSPQFKELCEVPNLFPETLLGATVSQNDDDIFYYIAIATDQPAPDGMFAYEIPAGTWAVFESNGSFKESVQTIFKRFLTEWLPFSGYTWAGLPDIEIYPFNKDLPQTGHSEVWIAVKKEKEA